MAQGGCPNIDFESGTFAGWSGGLGWCCPIAISNSTIQNGRHTIMSGGAFDSYTDFNVPMVSPDGGTYSVRLGNEYVDSEAEKLSYSMVVSPDNALFVYRYAVVFEDPDHDPEDQPRFEIRMFDQSGASIPCGIYNVYSTAGIPGFVETVDFEGDVIRYKNWTSVGMDLSQYMGQTVTIEFSTGDCSLGAHFGYAYIDCECAPLVINSEFCPGNQVVVLEAPEGFASYLWSNGETTPSITVLQPTTGQTFTCTVTSVTGCQLTLSAVLLPNVVTGGMELTGACANDITFTDLSTVTSGSPVDNWLWDFGDGSTSTVQAPNHEYSVFGPQTVTLIVTTTTGCTDTTYAVVDVEPAPTAGVAVSDGCQMQTLTIADASSPATVITNRAWNLGDGASMGNLTSFTHQYTDPGFYTVQLITQDANGCSDTAAAVVTVFQTPYTDLGEDQYICLVGETITLAANSPGTLEWSTGEATPTIAVTTPGTYSVVSTLGPCTDDDSVNILLAPDPGPLDDEAHVCPGVSTLLTIPYVGGHYLWDTGDTTRTLPVTDLEDHTYSLIDAFGCAYDGLITVTLNPIDLGVTVPNVITPNRDGHNETFRPDANGSSAVAVTILNRFGQKLFESNDLIKCWDGTFGGDAVPEGTYFYIVTYKPSCADDSVEQAGTVTVLR